VNYVIIGASAAGINAAKTLRLLDKEGNITIISKDVNVYSRCMLHFVISGKRDTEGISFIEDDFFKANNINWIKGTEVISINENEKMVMTDKGEKVSYDKLLIASGASAAIPPIKNLKEAKNVVCLRNIEDSLTIKDKCKPGSKVVVIGGGLVGIDAVVGLIENSVQVTLVEMSDRILPLQLDKEAASKYEKLFKEKNVNIITKASVKEVGINEDNIAHNVYLSSSEVLLCDFIIVAAGVKPNTKFTVDTSIEVKNGIVIDSGCRTNVKDIYAAGDVTAIAPIWPAAVKQGKNAAVNMAGLDSSYNDKFAFQNSMNFLGLVTVSLGLVDAPDNSYITFIERNEKSYKKIILKDGIIEGAIIQGDVSYCGILSYIIKNKMNISNINKDIFNLSFADFYNIKENGEYSY
jgi:NAD(P)H-nitrite reductase large subunit